MPITLIDLEHHIIPNVLSAIGAVAAIALVIAFQSDDLVEHLIAALGAGGFFLIAAIVYPAGMGMGDVKLAAVMGLFLGRAVVPAIFAALVAGTRRGRGRDRAPGRQGGPQEGHPVRPVARVRQPRRPVRGRRDRRLVPRHLHVRAIGALGGRPHLVQGAPGVVPIPGAMRAVNLLPPDTRGASKVSADLGAGPEAKGGAGPFVVLGVLAACVAGAAGYVLTDNTVKQRPADLAQVTARQQRARRARPPSSSRTPTSTRSARARVQTVKDLATSRFDWEQALRDLSRADPAGRHAARRSRATSARRQRQLGPLRGAISAPAITITGCAPGQTAGRPPDGPPG